MGIEITSIGWIDLTSPNTLFIAADIILILIALFLLIRFKISKNRRRSEVEPPKIEKQSELLKISDIRPDEFNPERLELTKSASSAPLIRQEVVETQEPEGAQKSTMIPQSIAAPEPIKTSEPVKPPEPIIAPEPTVTSEPISESTSNNVSVNQPENIEAPGEETLEIDEYELEDDFPEEFSSTSEPEIPSAEMEEEMLEEEIDISLEPEVTPREKEEEVHPTLPLELHLTHLEKEEKNTSEKTTLPLGLDMMVKKDEVKPVKVLSVALEHSITQPEPEVKITDTDEVKPVEVSSVIPEPSIAQPQPEANTTDTADVKPAEILSAIPEPSIAQPQPEANTTDTADVKPVEVSSIVPEPSIEQPEPEIKLFNFETNKESKPVAPPEQGLAPVEKEDAKAAENVPEPEIKLFNFDARMETKPETVKATSEQGLTATEIEGRKAAEDVPEPEIKLFNFEAGMETKTKTPTTLSEKVIPGETEVPAAGVTPGEAHNQDRKEKKAKRKSLF